MNTLDLQELRTRLLKVNNATRSKTIQDKTESAMSKVKHAQTLLDQAKETLLWAERAGKLERPDTEPKGKTLCEVFAKENP